MATKLNHSNILTPACPTARSEISGGPPAYGRINRYSVSITTQKTPGGNFSVAPLNVFPPAPAGGPKAGCVGGFNSDSANLFIFKRSVMWAVFLPGFKKTLGNRDPAKGTFRTIPRGRRQGMGPPRNPQKSNYIQPSVLIMFITAGFRFLAKRGSFPVNLRLGCFPREPWLTGREKPF